MIIERKSIATNVYEIETLPDIDMNDKTIDDAAFILSKMFLSFERLNYE